jgi:hypothetical protein
MKLTNLINTLESTIDYYRNKGDNDKVDELKEQLKKVKSLRLDDEKNNLKSK